MHVAPAQSVRAVDFGYEVTLETMLTREKLPYLGVEKLAVAVPEGENLAWQETLLANVPFAAATDIPRLQNRT